MVLAAVLASQAAKSVDDVDDCGSWSVATTSIIVTCSSEGLQCMYSRYAYTVLGTSDMHAVKMPGDV
jgi:hypothetical protein